MKQARSNATNTKRTASSLPPNNFIGSDEHSADAPHYTTASSLGADQLLSAFYRYHFFFTAIPLIFALVHTSFRGEGDLCVFDGVSLGVYLSGVRGAGAASAVFDERTDQQREFGVPLDAAWVTAEFLLGASVFNVGAWWVLITISGAVQVEEREEEAKTVTSGVFASSLLCFIAPYCLVGGGGTYLTLSAEDPEKRNSMRVILTLLVPLLVLLWIAADRARHRCTASKQPRRGRTIFCVAKFVFAYTLWGGLTLIFGIQFVIILFPAVLRSVQDWPPLWKSAVELLATGFYFILWIPLMEKAGGKIILPMQESLLVFSIRVSRATWSGFEYGSPNSFESHLFRLMSGLQRLTQLPRKLAVSFEEKYDFLADERARQAFYSGETSCDMQSVWFSFCNVRLVVENVPTELLRSVCCPVALPFAEGSSVLAALVFLAKDLLEWYVITFKFMLCSEWRIEQFVPALFNEIGNPGFECRRYTYDGMAQAVAMGVLGSAAYFCALMFALRWNAYNMLEIQTVTGHRDLEWKEVYGFCKEGGVA
eukprot:g6943.t1